MRKLILFSISILLLVGNNLFSQHTINASGGTIEDNGGSISFSVGQLVTTTISSQSGSVTPGVFISLESSLLSNITALANVKAFPNPTTDKIQIDFGAEASHMNMNYKLFDQTGRRVKSGTLSQSQPEIDLLALPSSLYVLYLQDETAVLKIIKIIKLN